jgi:hypothetical protein
VEHTLAFGPELDELLDDVLASDLIAAAALPASSEAERRPPE